MAKHPHLEGLWDTGEAAAAKDAVRQMMEMPGWTYLTEAVEARLRYEQKIAMNTVQPREAQTYAQMHGEWKGLTRVADIAQDILKNGDEAEAKLRAA